MGMQNSDWRLAARLLEDPDYFVVARGELPQPDYAVFYWPDPDQLPTYVFETGIVPAGASFPYGNEVEPD